MNALIIAPQSTETALPITLRAALETATQTELASPRLSG
jgi:hypothetical protein